MVKKIIPVIALLLVIALFTGCTSARGRARRKARYLNLFPIHYETVIQDI